MFMLGARYCSDVSSPMTMNPYMLPSDASLSPVMHHWCTLWCTDAASVYRRCHYQVQLNYLLSLILYSNFATPVVPSCAFHLVDNERASSAGCASLNRHPVVSEKGRYVARFAPCSESAWGFRLIPFRIYLALSFFPSFFFSLLVPKTCNTAIAGPS